MPELTTTLIAKRDQEHENRKFLAAMQGIDLDNSSSENQQKKWEDLKAKVFSGGKSLNSDDVTSLQGYNAAKAGFGIGNGLEYTDLRGEQPKNPLG